MSGRVQNIRANNVIKSEVSFQSDCPLIKYAILQYLINVTDFVT